ncbi:lipoprotein [Leptospira yanagawae]|uniref:lipoprotein n=1 Tax=Leptospira yanagawae TaxID=293069 RepID=UPI000587FECF|nr:lipoprotein [Leptospira yanagawae]
MFRSFIFFSFFCLFFSCSNGDLSNVCDVNSNSYIEELFFRITTKDKSFHCGYQIQQPREPICSLSYEQVHLTENWDLVKKEVEAQSSLGVSGPEALIQYSPNSVAAAIGVGYPAFQSALSAPNGKVYLLPYNSPYIISIDPNNRSYALSTSVAGLVDFIGGTLGPDGKIYLSPHQNNDFFEFNTSDETISTIGNITMGGAAYNGGVFAPNGKIYYVPSSESIIRYYDTNTKSLGSISNPVTGGIFANGVLTPEGKIYFIPHDATNIHILDTNTETVSEHPFNFGGSGNFISGIYATNGKIYLIPYNASNVFTVDTKNNDTVTNLGNLPTPVSGMFNGVVLSPNGKIYPIPYNYSNFISIDPRTDTYNVLMANPSSGSYRGGAIGVRGEIYLSPHNADRFDLLDTKPNGSFCDPIRLSPYWNKF